MTAGRPKQGLVAVVITAAFTVSTIAMAKDAPPPEIPKCDKKYGTLAVKEPENNWWRDLQLESPEALIKVFVSESELLHAGGPRQGTGRPPRPSARWPPAASCAAARTSARAR